MLSNQNSTTIYYPRLCYKNTERYINLYKNKDGDMKWLLLRDRFLYSNYWKFSCDTLQEALQLSQQGLQDYMNFENNEIIVSVLSCKVKNKDDNTPVIGSILESYITENIVMPDYNKGVLRSTALKEHYTYQKTEQGFKAGELNCIIASQGTGKSMVNDYIQARNACSVINAMQNLNVDDISL